MFELPEPHEGECFCDEGEFLGDKVHAWNCGWLACVLGECKCEEFLLAQLEDDAQRYLEGDLE